MRFAKLGLIYCPDGSRPLMRAHAMLPTPILMQDVVRVFFASTDENTRGRVFSVDLDADDPRRVIGDVRGPALGLGDAGAFDADGVVPASMLSNGSDLRLYYAGFERVPSVPYTLFMGLAASTDGGQSFRRLQLDPLLPAVPSERYFRTAPCVRRDERGWSMWYIGGNEWVEHDGKKLPVYGLRHTRSSDGVSWSSAVTVLQPDRAVGQIGFGRPAVLETDSGFRMYLSVRTVHGYTVSHATSSDGLQWTSWDHDILPAGDTWDSQMRCYAAPLVLKGDEYLFYNGNGYGRTGFGLAIREQ